MNLGIKFAALSFIFIFMTSGSLSARPNYANQLGETCAFCHIGQMKSKKFTKDGLDFCIYLKGQNALPKMNSCTLTKLEVFDKAGKSLGTHSICIQDSIC